MATVTFETMKTLDKTAEEIRDDVVPSEWYGWLRVCYAVCADMKQNLYRLTGARWRLTDGVPSAG